VRLVLLNLDDALDPDALAAFLPAGRPQMPALLATAFDAPRVVRQGGAKSPVNWDGVASAIAKLVVEARQSAVGRDVEYFIAGRAPLPAFVHLGFELSAFSMPPTLLNRRKDGTWDAISLASSPGASHATFFTTPGGLPAGTSEATGRIAVFVSTIGDPAPRAEIRRFVQEHGEELAAVVELITAGPALLTRDNAGTAAVELASCLSRIPGCFPYASGVALFVAGPAPLAFMAGRAVNPHMVRDLWVPNFDAGSYVPAITLPWRSRAPVLDRSDEAVAARRSVLDELRTGIQELKHSFAADMLLPLVSAQQAQQMVVRLQSLKFVDVPEGDEFDLRVLEDRLSFGHALLEALRGESPDVLRRAAGLFVLHELYHDGQGLRSTNFAGIGRAGVALEEVDYWADAVAISALAKNAAGTGAAAADALVSHVEAAIRCMEAFDRAEQGKRIERLAERRLRRYLIWHLQLARARTIRTTDDIDRVFADRVIAELAPLKGSLDAREDKFVLSAPVDCGLAIVVERKVIRHYASPSFSPALLVEAVRSFDWKTPEAAFDYVINEHVRQLVPWRTDLLS
jgi:hypothetical protein